MEGTYNESRYADPYQPISLTELKVLVIRGIALKLLVEDVKVGCATYCCNNGLVEHDNEADQGQTE